MTAGRSPTGARRATVVAGTAVLLAGCAGLQQPQVERVAADFATAGPAGRCALLAPATTAALEHARSASCAEAMRSLPLPDGGEVSSTSVWGDRAQVRTTGDTLFLARTGAGWRVVAAGCRSDGDAPYRCQVEGP